MQFFFIKEMEVSSRKYWISETQKCGRPQRKRNIFQMELRLDLQHSFVVSFRIINLIYYWFQWLLQYSIGMLSRTSNNNWNSVPIHNYIAIMDGFNRDQSWIFKLNSPKVPISMYNTHNIEFIVHCYWPIGLFKFITIFSVNVYIIRVTFKSYLRNV